MEKLTHDKSLAACVCELKCMNMGRVASLWPLAHKFEITGAFEQATKHQMTFILRMLWKLPEQWLIDQRVALLILPSSVLNQQKYKWLHSVFFYFPLLQSLRKLHGLLMGLGNSHLLLLKLGSRLFDVKSSCELQRAANYHSVESNEGSDGHRYTFHISTSSAYMFSQ